MRSHPDAELQGFGGERMKEQGVKILRSLNFLSFMGFYEVVKNISTIIQNFRIAKEAILKFKPRAVILIDYPGFNLRLAEFLKENNITCIYYISPQIWAWKESRVRKVKAFVDRMYVILPFELDFYKKHGMEVQFKGHPLLDALADTGSQSTAGFIHDNQLADKPLIALLPGSRKQEIVAMLPVMVEAIKAFPAYQAVVAGVNGFPVEYYHQAAGTSDLKVVYEQTYNLLRFSEAALVTSGTATLETGLIGTPLVVCYKGSKISYLIARNLVKVKYISLVNLILDRPLLKELIQDDMNVENLRKELKAILKEGEKRQALTEGLKSLRSLLGGEGASERIALDLLNYLNAR